MTYQNQWNMTAQVAEQKRYRITMLAPGGDVIIRVKAANIQTVRDQVNNRRLPQPPGMIGFDVEEDE